MGATSQAAHKLGLGTAQFGLDYGLTSQGVPVGEEDVGRILILAQAAAINLVDTAPAYGSSEVVLGRGLARLNPSEALRFRIVTKLPSLRKAVTTVDKLALAQQSLNSSLSRLGCLCIYGLILHDPDDLRGPHSNALVDLLYRWKEEARVQRVGVSVYEAHQIDDALKVCKLDLVQLPISVFDQRILAGGHLVALRREGCEIHARSVILQGLLLMDESELPRQLASATSHLTRYRAALGRVRVSPLAAALGFVRSIPEIDHIVVGVHSSRHLTECLTAIEQPCPLDFTEFALDDLDIIDPRRWTRPT
jgi:aryl-alcohol dehydrogenase-like predicted oxidoreductase